MSIPETFLISLVCLLILDSHDIKQILRIFLRLRKNQYIKKIFTYKRFYQRKIHKFFHAIRSSVHYGWFDV